MLKYYKFCLHPSILFSILKARKIHQLEGSILIRDYIKKKHVKYLHWSRKVFFSNSCLSLAQFNPHPSHMKYMNRFWQMINTIHLGDYYLQGKKQMRGQRLLNLIKEKFSWFDFHVEGYSNKHSCCFKARHNRNLADKQNDCEFFFNTTYI